jgi:rfaE bifunctional protein kinase chain/domain/rfaE bifunctional protein nucleotidyltransferase chain/domain
MSLEFFDKYKHKIINKNQIKKIKSFNKKKTIVLCHGVFDIVHPGHLRHLAHAKSKGDILIVSITADKFIEKGLNRPHVPENLRALNLSVFEMVDYVIIDRNKTAIDILNIVRPDFYVKGFEYFSSGLPVTTKEEMKLVKKYKGRMIFSPGDFVYSSTKILNSNLPRISMEKLLMLLNKNNLNFDKIKKSLKKFRNTSVHIIGDTILDTYTSGSFIGGQTKTPTFSILKQKVDNYIGGAAIVALHLKESGAKVNFTTVLGDDHLGRHVIENLKQKKIFLNSIIDVNRPTTNKNTIQTGAYKLLKVDTLDNTPISEDILNKICKNIRKIKSDIVILSDFRHGIFNKYSIQKIIDSIPKKIFKVADSQVASRWGNIIDFKKFDLITPNEKEARFSLADQDSSIGTLANLIKAQSKCKNLILKLGDKGIFCLGSKNENLQKNTNYFSLDSFAGEVIDPIGSGDALLAYSSLSLYNTRSLIISGIIGSLAAASECESEGNIPISINLIEKKLEEIMKKIKYKIA